MARRRRLRSRKATDLTETAGLSSRGIASREVYSVKISNEQIEKIKQGDAVSKAKVDTAVIKLTDSELILRVTRDVNNMPDRENMIDDLKARIEAGTYNPSGDEIIDTMIRRAIADKIRD